MPRYWHDYHACDLPETATQEDVKRREFNLRILAEKKPYFMRYIYPALMKQYNTYIKDCDFHCVSTFRVNISSLLAIPRAERTKQQNAFIDSYFIHMPVSINNGIMNRICRLVEQEFGGYLKRNYDDSSFDSSILKYGVEYTPNQYYKIVPLYKQYKERTQKYSAEHINSREDQKEDTISPLSWFREESARRCSNSQELTDIVVSSCYAHETSRRFAWLTVGHFIVMHLLEQHDQMISYPVLDCNGDFEFGGEKFRMVTVRSDFNERYYLG